MDDQLKTQIAMTNIGHRQTYGSESDDEPESEDSLTLTDIEATQTHQIKKGYEIAGNQVTKNVDQYESSSDDDIEMSRDSVTFSHSLIFQQNDEIDDNPKNWDWETVQKWLKQRNLGMMIEVFAEGATEKDGMDGDELLGVNLNSIMDNRDAYRAGEKLNIPDIAAAKQDSRIQSFFRELTKLQLKANADSSSDLLEDHTTETTINDYIEMVRRIDSFVDKWDKVLWIEDFVENNKEEPSDSEVSKHFGIPLAMAEVYLTYYGQKETSLKGDLEALVLGYNVYNDAVIWWYLIISSLQKYPSESLWLILRYIVENISSSVAIALLQTYSMDLTRFDAKSIDKVCENIVITSKYPICAALRIAKWFKDRGLIDIARSDTCENIAKKYIECANDYLRILKSDHLATVLLETKSDIDGLSALDMALKYKLSSFVSNNRIDRIATSMLNNFAFLKPANRGNAFEIAPLSFELIWDRMWRKEFYFTPIGLYTTMITLYLCYLVLFTYLSVNQIRVYDNLGTIEMICWIFNIGYVLNEFQQIIAKRNRYFDDNSNYFDTIISILIVIALIMRIYAYQTGPNCDSDECWVGSPLNIVFTMIWACCTIMIWLRLITFCVLSKNIGPMVQMVFRMLGDIWTFFQILFILFLGFVFSLLYIMGDVHSDFDTPLNSSLTLFRAILGDFDFGAFEEVNDSNIYLVYFGYLIMIIYLIVGSLILMNLLIAMMATTYENVSENSIKEIIFARFELANKLDLDAAFIPPPFNVFVVPVLILFYFIEWCINCFTELDLALVISPPWLKRRALALDEQILYYKCKHSWTITTHLGPTLCRLVKYKEHLNQHCIRFYKKERDGRLRGIKVSVEDNVAKKHEWSLNLMHLDKVGLIDLKQFEVKVDNQWSVKANQKMQESKAMGKQSPFWICGYCRGHVQESTASIKQLGHSLNVNDVELKFINKVSPVVCPNCYRVRYERKRWQFVWEIISLWIFYIIVFPLLLIVIGGFLLVTNISDLLQNLSSYINRSCCMQNDDDDDTDFDVHGDRNLIDLLNGMEKEHQLFDHKQPHFVWETLGNAMDSLDPTSLAQKIDQHRMNLSEEDELTTLKFFDDFINMDGLKKNGGDFLWNEYFQPLALTIFERIQKLRNDFVPLHLFRKYPFDINLVLDDFRAFFDERGNDKPLECIDNQDIVEALNELQSLNCINQKQGKAVINAVEFDKDEIWELDEDDTVFRRFVKFMNEVQALFQDTRTIKNMLRDVSKAIMERGIASSLFQNQLHFLFEDIRNVTLATAFFNSMRTELKKGELKVELWTIRNTLYALNFLSHAVRKNILSAHGRLVVEKQQLLNTVYRLSVHDIIDPEGITDLVHTDDHDESDGDNDDDDDDDDDDGMHEATKSFLFAQKSTVAIGALKEDHDEDEMDEAERHQIVVERMELFHKDAITASAVRDEVSSIFDKIQARRKLKITESAIDYYRRNGLKEVRLLQDDETLRYIFEQLSRYATFYPKHMKEQVSVDLLIKILQNTLRFGNNHKIDDETVPKMIQNERYITQLYTHLKDLYQDTIDNKFNSIIIEQTLEYMTLEDVLSMIMLYERTFDTLNTKIIEAGDTFVATHDVFCKFVDKSYDPDLLTNDRGYKTQAASNLFQSVLDEQKNLITLGQIRKTIDKLMNDIVAMKCGKFTRIMNHLHKQLQNDIVRCRTQRAQYVKFLRMNSSNGNEFQTQLTMDDDEAGATRNRGASKKKMKNPGFAFKHISKNEWTIFVDGLADNFQMNVQSTKISATLHDEEHKDLEAHKKEVEESGGGGKQIIESILDNTAFDIIKDRITEIAEDKEMEMEEEKYERVDVDDKKRKKTIRKKRNEVFDTALSFCAGRITLQQLFTFSKSFISFVRNNTALAADLKLYDEIVNGTDDNWWKERRKMREHKISTKIEAFKMEYFGEVREDILNTWSAEVKYLFSGCENKYDLCHKIYPFWSGSIFKDIYSFMESSEQIQGDYELKELDFKSGSFKRSLNVDDESAIKLFRIIRLKIRTLSWRQIYDYFKFLLSMKYNCQRAILKSKQAEDKTVYLDEIKLLLQIQLNDESVWLFNKVLSSGSTVNWRQIRNYLKKMNAERHDIMYFFSNQQQTVHYNARKAKIIDSIKSNQESNEEKQEKIFDKLAMITEQLKTMQKEMKTIKNSGRLNANKSKITKNLGVGGGPRAISFQDSKEQEEMDNVDNIDKYNGNTANMDISQVVDLEAAGHRYTSTPL